MGRVEFCRIYKYNIYYIRCFIDYFKYGFISSSDNHQAAPGSGYKELFGNNIDFSGPSSEFTDKLLRGPTYDLNDRDYVDNFEGLFEKSKRTFSLNSQSQGKQRIFVGIRVDFFFGFSYHELIEN